LFVKITKYEILTMYVCMRWVVVYDKIRKHNIHELYKIKVSSWKLLKFKYLVKLFIEVVKY